MSRSNQRAALASLPLAALLAATCAARADDSNSTVVATPVFDAIGREVRALYEANRNCLVQVRSESAIGTLSGTGFFIDDKGTVVTTSSLVGDSSSMWIERDDKRYPVHVLGIDRRSSVAVLKTITTGTPLRLAPVDADSPGQPVIVLGFPFNQPAAPAFGFISGFDSQNPDKRYLCTTHIRADLNLTPGLIGGPMLNTRGEVIGLVTGTLDGGRSCYALPVSALRRVTEDLSTVGRYQAAWIGLLAGRRPEGDDAPGLPIYRIFSNSPAARAGVAVGDRLLRLGDIQVATPFDVVRGSFLIRAGQPVNITVSRMGASRDLTVAAELRPVSELPEPLRRLTAQTNAIGVQVDLR